MKGVWVKKGMKMIRIFTCAGMETGSVVTIVSISKTGVVKCDDSDSTRYDARTLREIDSDMMGQSRLIQVSE